MIQTSDEYKKAIKNHEPQHILGQLNFVYGTSMILSNDVLVGTPTYSRQCTKVESEFGVGQLYTGTAEITVRLPKRYDSYYALLRGGSFFF